MDKLAARALDAIVWESKRRRVTHRTVGPPAALREPGVVDATGEAGSLEDVCWALSTVSASRRKVRLTCFRAARYSTCACMAAMRADRRSGPTPANWRATTPASRCAEGRGGLFTKRTCSPRTLERAALVDDIV